MATQPRDLGEMPVIDPTRLPPGAKNPDGSPITNFGQFVNYLRTNEQALSDARFQWELANPDLQGEARSQLLIAHEQQMTARQEREQAMEMARRTPSEIEMRNDLNRIRQQVIGQSRRELDFLQQGLDFSQPGAYEQGAGLFSSILLRQRQAQRGLMESQLRQRFGAGYATSSAGQAALQQFDAQTSDLATGMIPNLLQSQTAAITQQAAYENAIMGRELAAATRTSMVPYAGSQYAGQLIQARQDAQSTNSLWSTIGTIGGAALGYALAPATGGMSLIASTALGAQIGGYAGGQLAPAPSSSPAYAQGSQMQNYVQQPMQYGYIAPSNYYG